MKNIWLVLIPSLIAYIVCVSAIVYEIIKKPAYQLIKICVFVGVLIFLIITDIPCYKDMAENTTTTVIAEYVEFQSSNTLPGTRKVFFENEDGEFFAYFPTFTRDIAKMEVGQTYEIEYFQNTHIIKSYRRC